jgi:hypothetical protein
MAACTHASVLPAQAVGHPAPLTVKCTQCGQKFGRLNDVREFVAIAAVENSSLDMIRRIRRLATEALVLGVLIEFDGNLRSPNYGAVVGVRKPEAP